MKKPEFTPKAERRKRIIKGYAREFNSFRVKNLSASRKEMSPDYASPLAVVLAVFCLSEMLFLAFTPNIGFIISAITLCLSSVPLFVVSQLLRVIRAGKVLRFTSFIIFALSLGIFTATFFGFKVRTPSEKLLATYPADEEIPLVMRIDKVISSGENFGIYDATLIGVYGRNTKEQFGTYPKARVSCFGQDPLETGSVVSLSGILSRPEKVTDDGFRQRRYLESQSIFISCEAKSTMTLLAHQEKSVIEKLRSRLSMGLKKYTHRFGKDVSGIARCMLLGEKQAVTDFVNDVFRASGVSHVLSVSGMHLSILFFIIGKALRLGKRKRRRFPLAEVVSCLIALVYMAITGFTPSIMRAGFMLILANVFSSSIYYIKKLGAFAGKFTSVFSITSRAKPPKTPIMGTLTCLLSSAAIISVISPYSLYDIGMQLSFMSTLGIIISLPALGKITKLFGTSPLSYVLSSFAVTLFAVGFTFPVSIYNFGTVSPFSPLANLFLMPLATPLLILLLLLALLSLLPTVLPVIKVCETLGLLCGVLCKACIVICDYFARFTYSVLDAENNILVNVLFVILTVSAFVFASFSKRKISSAFGFGTVLLYLLCLVFYFFGTYKSRCIPKLTLCTVAQRPYACVSVKSSRIVMDCGTSLAETKHALSVIGETLYKTDTVYVVITSSDFAPEYVLSNIDAFGSQIGTVLLLAPEKAQLSGVDADKYAIFTKELSQKSIDIGFYSESFSVSDLEFNAYTDTDKTAFTYDDTSVVFAKMYDEEYASCVSQNSDYCIYFCNSATKTENALYTGDGKLFVSSSQQKKIKGSLKIPTGKATLFSKN